MKRWMERIVVVGLIVLGSLPVAGRLHAQGDGGEGGATSNDTAALITEVVTARERVDGWRSYAEAAIFDREQTIRIGFGRQVQTATTRHALTRRAVFQVTGEGEGADRDLDATIQATFSEPSTLGSGRVTTTTINAEVRRVDGVLYVRAQYETPNPNLPRFPLGWTVVELGADDAYSGLSLGDILVPSRLSADADLLTASVTDVRRLAITPANGEAYDEIVLTIGSGGMAQVLAAGTETGIEPALAGVLREALDAESAITITAMIGPEGDPIGFDTVLRLQATGIDAHALDADRFPRGVTVDIFITTRRTERFSAVNAPVQPLTVPRVGR